MSNSSFLPEDYLERRASRRSNLLCLVLFAVVMAGVGAAFVVDSRQDAEVMARKRQVNARYEEAAKRIDQLDVLKKQRDQWRQKASVKDMLLEKAPRTLVLSELINAMPATVSWLELGVETKTIKITPKVTTALDKAKLEQPQGEGQPPAPPPEQKYDEVSLSLVGLAPTDVQVAQYMTVLGQSQLFSDLNLAFSEEVTVEENVQRKFRIEFKIRQGVDVQKLEPTMVKRELKANPMGEKLVIEPSKGGAAKPVAIPVALPAAK